MKFFLFLILSLFTQTIYAQKVDLLKDIYRHVKKDRISFGNSKIRLDFRKDNGLWIGLRAADDTLNNCIQTVHFDDTFDFIINGKPAIKNNFLTYKKGFFETKDDFVLLTFIYEVTTSENLPIDVQLFYRLYPEEARVERYASIRRVAGTKMTDFNPKFEYFVFKIPSLKIGNSAECVINTPGPFFTHSLIKPNTLFDSLKTKKINLHQAPEAGFGLMTILNPFKKMGIATWVNTKGKATYESILMGDGKNISFIQNDHLAHFFKPNQGIQSDVQTITFGEDLAELTASFQEHISMTLPLEKNTPKWVKDAVILEVYPKLYQYGLKELSAKLPYYQKIGFNTIYLMPHWLGGYMPINPFEIDPQIGTEEELKQFVAKAHTLGIKVLFDMVIHGFSEQSEFIKSHAQMFVHDEKGNLALHQTWKSVSTDWASPKYQSFMIGLVLHDLEKYNIDGYRIDAASFKGPGWDFGTDNPAYASGSDAVELLRLMLKAMRQKKSDVVFLNEVFGPAFLSVSNFGHDNQTEAPTQILELLKKKQYTAADYKKYLLGVYGSLQEGINRVFFARNHDTSWFYYFDGYTPQYMALDAIHAFFGIPEVFAGDPDNEPIPREFVFNQYAKIFEARNLNTELKYGEINLQDIISSNPNIFSGMRILDKKRSVVLVSLSSQTEETTIEIAEGESKLSSFEDVLTKEKVAIKKGKISLKPYQILLGK